MSEQSLYTLPNGQIILHHNQYETEFVYREIFENKVYFKHGITLEGDASVLDVGANIGLFALYVSLHYPSAKIFSFEPAPQNCRLFQHNLEKYPRVKLFQQGLAGHNGEAQFTYYPGYSIMSGFHADSEEDTEVLKHGITQQLKQRQLPEPDHKRFADLMLGDKLQNAEHYSCALQTVSSFIEQENIEQIDLLKVDAEKAEMDIFSGIGSDDWNLIQKIVVEVHDPETASNVTRLLTEKGLRVLQEQEAGFGEAGIYNLYAFRH